jgi:hypothetical protein
VLGQPGEGLGRHGHGVDMLIMRVSSPAFDGRLPDNRVVVRFRVNQQPDQTWIPAEHMPHQNSEGDWPSNGRRGGGA